MKDQPILHFLCGKAGAGKSTISKKLAAENSAILISEDIWLMRLFGDQMKTFDDYKVVSQKLRSVVGPLVTDLLKSGKSVVLDFPANSKASRLWFRSIFEEAGAAHALHFVNSPNHICLQRIAQRNIERPEGSHHLTNEQFEYISSFFEAPDELEAFHVTTYTA